MPIRLVPLDDTESLPTIIVDRPIVLIGRHPECDVQIRSSKVSRKHCCLADLESEQTSPMSLAVRDLDSTNGTRINGKIIAEGRLAEGDELTIGAFRFRLIVQNGALGPQEKLVSTEYPIPILESPHDHILDNESRTVNPHQTTPS